MQKDSFKFINLKSLSKRRLYYEGWHDLRYVLYETIIEWITGMEEKKCRLLSKTIFRSSDR